MWVVDGFIVLDLWWIVDGFVADSVGFCGCDLRAVMGQERKFCV